MNLNNVTLIGHLTKDPESKEFGDGKHITRFTIATNRKQKDRPEEVEFHSVVAFGGLAAVCGKILSKGRLVYIQGRLKTSRWEDKQQIMRSKTEIIAGNMLLLDKKQALVSASPDLSEDDASEAVIELTSEFTRQPNMATVQ